MRHGLQTSPDCQRDPTARKRLRTEEAPCRTWESNFLVLEFTERCTREYAKGFWNISFYLLYHPLRWLPTSKGHANEAHALTTRQSDLPRANPELESPLLILKTGSTDWGVCGDKEVLFSSIQMRRLPPALTIWETRFIYKYSCLLI